MTTEEGKEDSSTEPLVNALGDSPDEGKSGPPDGGWGWVVVFASFMVHITTFGLVYSFGVLFISIREEYGSSYGETALIHSINQASFFVSGTFAGKLTLTYGCRRMCQIGAVICTVGLVLSSFATSIWQLFIFYGVIYGVGMQISFNPCIAAINQWFSSKKGIAFGIAVAGSGMGPFVGGPLTEWLTHRYGIVGFFRVMAVTTLVSLFLCGCCYRTVPNSKDSETLLQEEIDECNENKKKEKSSTRFLDFSLMRDPVMWCLCSTMVMSAFGYLVPITHTVAYAMENGASETQASLLVSYFGIASTCGRLLLGRLADYFPVVYVYCLSMLACGVITALGPLYHNLLWFGIYFAAFGFFSGSFIALSPYLVAKYVGDARMAEAYGMLFTFGTPGTFLGAPTAGWIRDATGSYNIGFIIGGVVMIFGTLPNLQLPWVVKWKERRAREKREYFKPDIDSDQITTTNINENTSRIK